MSINDTRWKIGWRPMRVIVSLLVVGIIVGAMAKNAKTAMQLGVVGLIAGVGVWLWGRAEVNGKYKSLLEDFRDQSRSRIERETGGMEVTSAYTFISGEGGSPPLIEPKRTYRASHLLFGDTSVVINRQYSYGMKERKQRKGGKQQEVFYDQISNVQSEDYKNYAELEISLSSSDTQRIQGRNTARINEVKSDLQQKMRESRRGRQRRQPAQREPPQRETARRERPRDRSGSATAETTADAERRTGQTAAAATGDAGQVSTDWLTGESSTTLRVRNDADEPKPVRVGCRVDGEKRLTDDVHLAPGEIADWDDLPDSQFEVGVVVDGGPSGGERVDPASRSEIKVAVTDAAVTFGDWPDPEPARDAGSTGEATTTQDADDSGTTETSQSTEADGTASEPSGIASRVFGGSESGDDESASDDADESWSSASELASAVQQSPSYERVKELTSYLDASASSERRAAIRGLRQSVKQYPDPVASSVSSVAALLDDADGETREEATVTLQRLAESHPDVVAETTDRVIDRLDDESPKVRIAACRVLDAVDATAGTEKLQELADGDRHKGVQVAAFNALQ